MMNSAGLTLTLCVAVVGCGGTPSPTNGLGGAPVSMTSAAGNVGTIAGGGAAATAGGAAGTMAGGTAAGGSAGGSDAQGCDLHAAPNGAGTECSMTAPCSLEAARDQARARQRPLSRDLNVCLAGGTYELAQTFALTDSASVHDSGGDGFNVVYRAAGTEQPVLSGGRTVSGFVADADGIYKAAVDASIRSRHLYVDGVRAIRAQGPHNQSGFTPIEHGFNAPDASLSTYGNPTGIELVGFNDWKNFRCPVESISGTAIKLADPCWALANNHAAWPFKSVAWAENARELLDEPGEFYLDEVAHQLYYKPRPGEDLTQAKLTVPVVETLVSLTGTADAPIHDVVFKGITFAFNTWLLPSTTKGYPCLQSGFFLADMVGNANDHAGDKMDKSPSSVSLIGAHAVRFERNQFVHLGSGGIDVDGGSQDNVIVGNRFQDISGRGVTIGHVDEPLPSPAQTVKGNVIANNFIADIGVEYADSPAVLAGITEGTRIEHNTILRSPYTAVSVGWGWDFYPKTIAKDNVVSGNRIESFMGHLNDGGGIYFLGPQPNSKIERNYLLDGGNGHGLYPDEGTGFTTWSSNVVDGVKHWLFVWTPTIHDNKYIDNFSVSSDPTLNGTNDAVMNNMVVADKNWPAAAQAVIDEAGLEAAYKDVAPAH